MADMRLTVQMARSNRGAVMIEFAIVLPLLLTMLLGIGDLAPMMMARLKSAIATQSLSDLVTRSSLMQSSDMVNAYTGALSVLAPFSTATMVMRVTSVASDGAGHALVYWSCGQGTLMPLTAGSTVTTLPTGDSPSVLLNGMMVANTSYVVAETQYTFTAPTRFLLKSPIVMATTSYMLPRTASYVGFPWSGSSTVAPTAPASATKTSSVALSNGAVCNYAT